MAMGKKTKPEVFIIESLTLNDEKKKRQEGDLIARMLQIAGKSGTQYFYIRTRRELEEIVDEFDDSCCRYLHISCHANRHGMATTFDDISYADLGQMLSPCLDGRRVFVSACEMATENLAAEILNGSGCYSLIGPKHKIRFDDAASFWVAFYHLMFKANQRKMNRDTLRRRIKELSVIYEEPVNYFRSSTTNSRGFVQETT
ncbi:MAG: hypothetical protein JNM30_14040 [Rhodospirillales bacterium]|nr:hypothetical protein [Rhodospirillales bacterium]